MFILKLYIVLARLILLIFVLRRARSLGLTAFSSFAKSPDHVNLFEFVKISPQNVSTLHHGHEFFIMCIAQSLDPLYLTICPDVIIIRLLMVSVGYEISPAVTVTPYPKQKDSNKLAFSPKKMGFNLVRQ